MAYTSDQLRQVHAISQRRDITMHQRMILIGQIQQSGTVPKPVRGPVTSSGAYYPKQETVITSTPATQRQTNLLKIVGESKVEQFISMQPAPVQIALRSQPKYVAREEYNKTGVVPDWAKEQITIPPEIKGSGADETYYKFAYSTFFGKDTRKLEKQIGTQLRKSKWYMEEHAVYGENGKTWEQLKKEEPALYMTIDSKTGMFSPQYNVSKWAREHWEKDLGEVNSVVGAGIKLATGMTPKQGAVAVTGSFLNVLDPGYWVAGDKLKYMYEKQYGSFKQFESGDTFGSWWTMAKAPMMTVVIPALAGAGFVSVFGAIGSAGTSATAAGLSTTGAVLSGYSVVAPVVAGATLSTLIGVDIGMTAAKQKTGSIWGDFAAEETRTKIAYTGTAMVSAYAGAKWASDPQTVQAWKDFSTKFGKSYQTWKTGFTKAPVIKQLGSKIETFRQSNLDVIWGKQSVRAPNIVSRTISGRRLLWGDEYTTYEVQAVAKNIRQTGFNWSDDPFATVEYSSAVYRSRFGMDNRELMQMGSGKITRPETFEYKYYSYYTPTKLDVHLENIAFAKQMKIKMPSKTLNIKTETKVMINPNKPFEAKFISSTDKTLMRNINLENIKYKNFDTIVSNKNLLTASKLTGSVRDTYSIGKIKFFKETVEVSGVSYYRISKGNVFFQEKPFYSKSTIQYLGRTGQYDISSSTGYSTTLGSKPITTIGTYGGKSITYPNSTWAKVIGDIYGMKQASGYYLGENITPMDLTIHQTISTEMPSDTIRITGKYGSIEHIKGDYTLQQSFTKFVGRANIKGTIADKATIFKPESTIKGNYSGGSSKFDPGQIATSGKLDIVMPGGIMSTPTTKIHLPQLFQGLSKVYNVGRTPSLSTLESMEYGTTYVSGYWSGTTPVMIHDQIPTTVSSIKTHMLSSQGMIQIPTLSLLSIPKLGEDLRVSPATLNKQDTSLINLTKTATVQITAQAQAQQQLQKQELKLDLKTIVVLPPFIPPITTLPPTEITDYIPIEIDILQPFYNSSPPPPPGFWFPSPDPEKKKKKKQKEFDIFGKQYRFRKFDLPTSVKLPKLKW